MNREEMLLVILGEECAELQQVIAKILRFGEGTHFANNVEELKKEFNDILGIAEMLQTDGLDLQRDEGLVKRKIEKVEYYLNESKQLGTLSDD